MERIADNSKFLEGTDGTNGTNEKLQSVPPKTPIVWGFNNNGTDGTDLHIEYF